MRRGQQKGVRYRYVEEKDRYEKGIIKVGFTEQQEGGHQIDVRETV